MNAGKILFPVMLIILGVSFCGCAQQDKTTQIFEIKNTQEIINNPNAKYIDINKYYIICNSPSDINKLKAIISKFISNNTNEAQAPKVGLKPRYFNLQFYRESSRLPQNWQPSEVIFQEDRIDNHGDDCIAGVSWADDQSEKEYVIYKKSSNESNYGEIIEEIH